MPDLTNLPIWNIITPAVVASLVTFYFNIRAEKKRAERDFITKVFDSARDDVRRALEAAVEYFPKPSAERSPLLEAKVWMGERDVRHSVAGLIEFCPSESNNRRVLQNSLDDFIDGLTGGSFQSANCEADLDQTRKVAAAGAKLRAAISASRQLELQAAITSDPLARYTASAKRYMTENLGPVDEPADPK